VGEQFPPNDPVDRRLVSPHTDERPEGVAITLAVIHAISLPPGRFAGDAIERFFLGTLDPAHHPFFRTIAEMRVSAHYLIRRDGETVEFVPPERRAWHAGVSSWRGQARCNDFAIGIELEGDDFTPFALRQYERLVALLLWLRRRFPTLTDVAGHCHIAPTRKTDPGPYFFWGELGKRLERAGERWHGPF